MKDSVLLVTSLALLATSSAWASAPQAQTAGQFEIHFDAQAFGAEASPGFSGDLLIAFTKEGEPRKGMHAWFNPPPIMRFAVQGVHTGHKAHFALDQASAMHPVDFSDVSGQTWKVQAIARLSPTGRQAGLEAGDVHSAVAEITYSAESDGVIALHLDQVVAEPSFKETDSIKHFEFESPALSQFHGFPYKMHAGVALPKDYDPEQTYPVLYSVTGFGGSYRNIRSWARRVPEGSPLEHCILVIPDANNRYGHSVFCDSPTNGPWGHALVNELIPALEKKYGGAGPKQRYVTGVSSGGWSSLWLQVTYPEQFSGCWSHVPDPIDFHDFQQINLYEPQAEGQPRNMFVDEAGAKRPVARNDGEVMLTYEDFVRREHVLNPGGQIRSFEATFSPRLPDGTPRRMFDVQTGAVDHQTAQAWRKYDISNTLLTRWDELAPKLTGKIHIYAGEVDTFYLEGAVERFQSLAKKQGLLKHMTVEVIPGMAHSLHKAGHEAMLQTIEAGMAVSAGK